MAEKNDFFQYDKEKMSVAEYQLLVKKMPRILKRKKSAGQHMRLAEMSRSELYQKLSDIVKIQKGWDFQLLIFIFY